MALGQRLRSHPDDDRGRQTGLALLVAAVALLGLGMWIGRASAPDAEPPAAPPADRTDDDDGAATGAPVDWPGPTDTEDGVPVGYARTREGAVAAAVNYDRTWNGAYGDRLAEVLDVIAASDAREDLRAGMEARSARTVEGMGLDVAHPDFAARIGYCGYVVDAFSRDAATVRLWAAGHMVDPRVGGLDAGWGTTTIDLVWEDSDWRLTAFQTAEGPTAEQANTGDPRRVGRAMNEFEEFRHVPN